MLWRLCAVVLFTLERTQLHGENMSRGNSEKKDEWTCQILPIRECECRRSQQCLVPFSCFTLCSSVWLWRYSWVGEVCSVVACVDWAIFCNGKHFVLFLNLYTFMFRCNYALSMITTLTTRWLLKVSTGNGFIFLNYLAILIKCKKLNKFIDFNF